MIFYDLETTCGSRIVMTPYLVTYAKIESPFTRDLDPTDIQAKFLHG